MKKEEIMEKAKKKAVVGEMERQKIGKANWIALIVACVIAVGFAIAEGALGHTSTVFVILGICATWACVFYTCQYFIAKRPWGVLIGAILEGLAAIAMIVLYVLSNVLGW